MTCPRYVSADDSEEYVKSSSTWRMSTRVFTDAAYPGESKQQNCCFLCGAPVEPTIRGLNDNRFGTPGCYEIHECCGCGLERTWPEPSLAELKRLYESQYNFGGETGTLYTALREWFLMSPFHRLWISVDGDISFLARRGSGRLLDVGCNEGRALRIYRRNGFEVEGLEINRRAATEAKKAGLEVHTCLIEEFVPPVSYDVAVLSNVLEHALDPAQMLREVRRILAPAGQVWISCPNGQSWMRRVFGRSWINWHVPFHISHFSAATISQLLESNGYTEVRIRQISPALWFAQSLITSLFAVEGRSNRHLRNPIVTVLFMLLARAVLFPLLWFGNNVRRGDCLIVTAKKATA